MNYINENENINIDAFKVFFIVSNESNIDNDIQYSLINKGMTNLKKIISKYLNNNVIVSVYCFEFVSKELEKIVKDKETKKYKALINAKYKNIIFKGIIFFKEIKNNFIYDFKFEENEEIKNFNLMYVELSKIDQLKMYSEVFKNIEGKARRSFIIRFNFRFTDILYGN